MPTVQDVIEYASSLSGLTADPARPECRAAYLALIAPGETEQRQAEMATMSGCALVCRGVWRHFIAHPILDARYRTGDAMSDLVSIGREAHALRPAGAMPQPGDVVVVGGGSDGGGSEHAWTCIESRDLGAGEWLATGIDGGQRDAKGFEWVIERAHDIGGGIDHCGTTRRRVRWVIDTIACVARLGR